MRPARPLTSACPAHGRALLAGACALATLLLMTTPARASWPLAGGVSTLATCGDGVIDAGEGCDDGNTLANDGCSASCEVEGGYECVKADISDGIREFLDTFLDTPVWVESDEGRTVTQTERADPGVYLTHLPATGARGIQFEVSIDSTTTNDDFLGVVLGFEPCELNNTPPDCSLSGDKIEYLLIDWKAATEGKRKVGLALSLVNGEVDESNLSEHTGRVRELARATNLAATGWAKQPYNWKLNYTETHLRLEVNEKVEFAIDAAAVGLTAFPAGKLGFYVLGQDMVTYTLGSSYGRSICTLDDRDGLSGAADEDEDNDGIPDALENVENIDPDDDSDGDDVPNYLDASDRGDETPAACPDDNNNRVCDVLDPLFDVDRDGKPNHRDLDADGDSIPDLVESGHDGDDKDKDGFLDGSAGANGIPDQVESPIDSGQVDAPRDTDGDRLPDFLDPDSDDDGELDRDDNCRIVSNAGQEDNHGTPAGDACEDTDDDGHFDIKDNCPTKANPGQENNYGAHAGDACEDTDDDGHLDIKDNCPTDDNPGQEDWDENGVGNACDPFTVSGSGCSSTDGSGAGALLLVLLALALVPRRRRRGVLASGLVASVLWIVPAAWAQDMPQDFPVERFRLAVDDAGLLGVEWAAVPEHLRWEVGLWLGAADKPLVLRREGEDMPFSELVSSQIAGSLIGGVSLWNRVQLGLELPLVVYQSSSGMLPLGFHEPASFGVGDIRILPKVQLLRAERHGVHLALIPSLTLPTGGGESYRGEAGLAFAPELVVSRALGGLRLSGNFGYRARQDTRMVDLVVADELFLHLGAGYRFDESGRGPPLEIDLALSGATAAASPLRSANQNHLELLIGASYRVAGPVVGILAGGLGVQEGFGTPAWRAVLGVRLSPPHDSDRDRDGIPDATDRCPLVPEDRDEFEDQDGCPDTDDDGDGVPDASDGAPHAPEDMDQHEDEDGVPDPDNDGDSLLDTEDKCPLEAETANGYQDDDGCPDELPDFDHDGVRGEADQCPQKPEDFDGFMDDDGCPEDDNDGDGVVDARDECASEPGPIESRGCPDADGDKVVDRLDNCPAKSGSQKNQGCPTQQCVRLAGDRIELRGEVHFKNNDHRILRSSHPLLRNLAEVLQAHPEIKRVRIEGHTDDRGDDAHNLALSQRRAEAVVAFLIGQGVAPSRLTASGFGETRPIADNTSAKGRATNRRVELHILGPQDDTTQSHD